MRPSWSAVVLLACACAAPETIQREIQLRPLPSPRGAFQVSDFSGEPETRRYRLKPGDLFASDAVAELVIRPTEGAPRAGDPAPESLSEAAAAIRALFPDASWDSDARFAVYAEKDDLVVRHVPAVLAQVERLIETLKAHRSSLLRLRIQFLTIPLEEMGAIRHLPPLREGLGGVIDRREIVTLAQACIPRRMSLTLAPALTLCHGQAGVVTMASRFPYLRAVEPREADYSAVIDEVTTGLQLRVRAVANGTPSDRFFVEASLEVHDLASITSLKLGDHGVQVPALLTSRSAGGFVLGPDQAAVLLGPPARSLPGIHGSLGSTGSEPKSMTLYILSVDRTE